MNFIFQLVKLMINEQKGIYCGEIGMLRQVTDVHILAILPS